MRECICGIYEIVNIKNQKRYIGQSIDVYRRWIQHNSELKRGKHSNEYLQFSWNKYGEDAFEFHILEECSEEKLNERELFYIQKFDTSNRDYGYNLGYVGDGVCVLSEEARQKMSQAQLIRWTEELRVERSQKYSGENNPFYGKHHSKETGRKIAEANKKRVWSDESRAKEAQGLAERNKAKRGSTVSQAVRDKISKTLKGRPSPNRKSVVQLNLNGDYISSFDSIKAASNATGITTNMISDCCRKLRGDARGFIWRYKEEYDAE